MKLRSLNVRNKDLTTFKERNPVDSTICRIILKLQGLEPVIPNNYSTYFDISFLGSKTNFISKRPSITIVFLVIIYRAGAVTIDDGKRSGFLLRLGYIANKVKLQLQRLLN